MCSVNVLLTYLLTCGLKVMILGEVEELLEVVDAKNFKTIAEPLFRQLSRSIVSPHFQVSSLYCVLLPLFDAACPLCVD